MKGKRALVLGVANERSIAWAIARALAAEGARVGLTYVGESLERRVRPLAEKIDAEVLGECDVTRDEDITQLLAQVEESWGQLDVVIHAVAFARRDNLSGRFVETDRAGFQLALDVSTYSLIALTRAALPLLARSQGTILTLTFAGSERVFPNYNVMGVAKAALESTVRYLAADVGSEGVRVNAIMPGLMDTPMAITGISSMRGVDPEELRRERDALVPLGQRMGTAWDIAHASLFLHSDEAGFITGAVLPVDGGQSARIG